MQLKDVTTRSIALSGLLNRRGVDRQAEKMVAEARRNDGGLSVIMIDLDHFKLSMIRTVMLLAIR